jgi:hypothetical protein
MSRLGMTANHGMSVIETHNEKAKEQRKILGQHSGLNVTCPKCKERFTFKGSNLDLCHVLTLEDTLESSCPMCALNPQQFLAVRHALLKFTVQVLGHEIHLLRIPLGFRAMKNRSTEIVDG